MSINGQESGWLEKHRQRQDESILQLLSNISPSSASEFITGAHSANELVHSLNTDVLIIAQRGGGFFDCAMKEFDKLLGRKELKTIYLPIGTQRDISKSNSLRNPNIEEKVEIVKKVIADEENIGKNITFVEEAKSGNSVIVFLEHILPLIIAKVKESESAVTNIIMMIDRGSPIDKDRELINQMIEKYGVQIHTITTSLDVSDKRSLADELIYDPNNKDGVPTLLNNEIIRSFIKLLSIGALYPNQLLDLLHDYFPPQSDLNEKRNQATIKLSQPNYINDWLLKYCQEIGK